jgi:hypothetical protein
MSFFGFDRHAEIPFMSSNTLKKRIIKKNFAGKIKGVNLLTNYLKGHNTN